MYTIYVSLEADRENDSGEIDQIGANANYRCTADLGFSAATNGDNRDCVAMICFHRVDTMRRMNRQLGYTLVELMIGGVLGLFLFAGALQVFLGF